MLRRGGSRCSALSFAFKSTSLWPTRSYAIIHHFPNEVNQAVIFGENPVLLDVREPDEHKKERIIGTVNVPLSVIKASQEDLSDISFKRPVYVHCDNGTRAVEAAKFLEKKGFADVRVIDVGVFELCRDGHFVKERG